MIKYRLFIFCKEKENILEDLLILLLMVKSALIGNRSGECKIILFTEVGFSRILLTRAFLLTKA